MLNYYLHFLLTRLSTKPPRISLIFYSRAGSKSLAIKFNIKIATPARITPASSAKIRSLASAFPDSLLKFHKPRNHPFPASYHLTISNRALVLF